MTDDETRADREAFIAAVRGGDLGTVKAMLDAGPGLLCTRRHGASAILIARYHGK